MHNHNLTSQNKPKLRCAIYTRKSCEEGLDQQFNSLDAQRLAAENYIASQLNEGWVQLPEHYDDGGCSGGNIERPALQRLFDDIREDKVDCIVVYKIDRLTRSLLDFATIISLLDKHQVTFVSITESFNTATPMGRLVLNVLLCFAQYERELTAERIRDKVDASKKQGMWMGGTLQLGYDRQNKKLVINEIEAITIKLIFDNFTETGSVMSVVRQLHKQGLTTKQWTSRKGITHGGEQFDKHNVRRILENPLYAGKIAHRGELYEGQHEAIINEEQWQKTQSLFNRKDRPHKIGNRLTTPPLLQGLLVCGECQASMVPTTTNKKGSDKSSKRRYRYYLCERKNKGRIENCAIGRIPAGEVEHAVIKEIVKLLKNPEVVAKTIETAKGELGESEVINALQSVESVWAELFPLEQTRIMSLLLKSVVVNKDGLTVNIRKQGLYTLTQEMGLNS